jgi:hypothetical protein
VADYFVVCQSHGQHSARFFVNVYVCEAERIKKIYSTVIRKKLPNLIHFLLPFFKAEASERENFSSLWSAKEF